MEVRKFAATITAKAEFCMFGATRVMTIDAAKDYAAIDYPGQRVVKVEVTKIEGPLRKWDPETGESMDLVDWVGHADVYLEESDDGA